MKKSKKRNTVTPTEYRQGDVLLVRVDALPPNSTKTEKDSAGRIVLAYGEVTGHAHAIVSDLAEPYLADGVLYVKADGAVELRHEEHGAIEVLKGIWRRVTQREYSRKLTRNVAD